jgi:DNA-binding NarL/FixJ family response regulator
MSASRQSGGAVMHDFNSHSGGRYRAPYQSVTVQASKAQVMLVDDHPMLRHGMAMLINLEADMEVFAEAGDGEEALATLKAGHHPDIVLIDVSLKTVSGFEVMKSMHGLIPALPVLVVSMHDEVIYAERALRAGARGYVMKLEPGRVLVAAIREILKGNFSLSKKIQATGDIVEPSCDWQFGIRTD